MVRKKKATKVDAKGYWKIEFPVPQADFKTHTIIINENRTIKNVLFGEVWVCSGQSNMEMPLKGYKNEPVIGSNKLIATSTNPFIRQFLIKKTISETALEDCQGSWKEANPKSTPNFTAVGYSFAKMLYESLRIPIGIINTSWGGTPAEAWIDLETLKTHYSDSEIINLKNNAKKPHQVPNGLYNGMVHPLVGLKIKGVIWCQGETNIQVYPNKYHKVFPDLITNWRILWDQGNFPFYYVQISPYNYSKKDHAYVIREVQLHTMNKLPNLGMATTTDIGEKHSIHPAKKIEVGERLAYWALNKDYGFKHTLYEGPIYDKMEIMKDKALIIFNNAPDGLTTYNNVLTNFYIAGNDQIFYKAKAKIKIEKGEPYNQRRHIVEVYHEKVPNPVAVRYCWSNWYQGNLYDTGGNPASPFRTDNWNLEIVKKD